MARLFMIGNGYDISRRGDTRYSDFKQWLIEYIKKHPECGLSYLNSILQFTNKIDSISTYSPLVLKNGVTTESVQEQQVWESVVERESIKRKGLAIAILFEAMDLLGDGKWNSFESNLSLLPLKDIINRYKAANDSCGMELMATPGCSVDKETDLVTSSYTEIGQLFAEWVGNFSNKEIQQKGFEKRVIKRIEKDDTFIIFNYSKTIENVFNCEDASIFYHIHGSYDDADSIIVGHSDKQKSRGTNLDTTDDYYNEFYAYLYKNTKVIIDRNKPLWNRLGICDSIDIYEYGWSCSEVDRDYIVKIVELLGDKIKHLYLNDFCDGGERKKQQWIKCGLSPNVISLYKEDDDIII